MNKRHKAIDDVLEVLNAELSAHEDEAFALNPDLQGHRDAMSRVAAVESCIEAVSKMDRGVDPIGDPCHIEAEFRLEKRAVE